MDTPPSGPHPDSGLACCTADILAGLFEVAPDGQLIVDGDGRILCVNGRCEQMFGYGRAELTGRGVEALVPAAARQQHARHREQFMAHPHSRAMGEQRNLSGCRKDGRRLPVDVMLSPFRSEGQRLILVVVRDVTERRRAEARQEAQHAVTAILAESEHLRDAAPRILEAVCEAAGWSVGALWLLDSQAGLLRCEEVWHGTSHPIPNFEADTRKRTFTRGVGLPGRTWQSGKPEHIPDVLNDPNFPRAPLAMLDGLHGASSFPILLGSELIGVMEFYSQSIATPDEELMRLFGTIGSQIGQFTRRKESEIARLRIASRMELLLSSVGEGIYGVDLEGRCTFINRAAAAMLGIEPEEAVGCNAHDLMHHHKHDGSPHPIADSPILRTVCTGECCRVSSGVLWRKDGTSFAADYSAHPIVEDRKVTGAVVAFADITERRQLEFQFLRSQRMESIGALSGGIAHDLNNALAPILLACEFLQMRVEDPECARVLDTVRDCAQRGAGMVKQILAFARGSGADMSVVQIKPLVGGMLNMARQTFPKSISIRSDTQKDIWTVPGNPTQLHQVLLNLCVNARDAMPEGGTLTLNASNAMLNGESGSLPPEARPGPHVLLLVRDTGIGMPPEVRARIFEPFFTTKEPEKGTGLGLSTVRDIVRNHHGFITVESRPGRGTEFKVFLPATESPVEAAPKPAPTDLPMGNGELILVVDDEAAIRSMNTHILQMFGYRVLSAGDGAQAVALFAQHGRDIQMVITDVAMPIMDGPATIRAIRSLAPAMKFLVASASESETCMFDRAGIEEGNFIPKPYSAEELLRTVHRLLQEKP